MPAPERPIKPEDLLALARTEPTFRRAAGAEASASALRRADAMDIAQLAAESGFRVARLPMAPRHG